LVGQIFILSSAIGLFERLLNIGVLVCRFWSPAFLTSTHPLFQKLCAEHSDNQFQFFRLFRLQRTSWSFLARFAFFFLLDATYPHCLFFLSSVVFGCRVLSWMCRFFRRLIFRLLRYSMSVVRICFTPSTFSLGVVLLDSFPCTTFFWFQKGLFTYYLIFFCSGLHFNYFPPSIFEKLRPRPPLRFFFPSSGCLFVLLRALTPKHTSALHHRFSR